MHWPHRPTGCRSSGPSWKTITRIDSARISPMAGSCYPTSSACSCDAEEFLSISLDARKSAARLQWYRTCLRHSMEEPMESAAIPPEDDRARRLAPRSVLVNQAAEL